MIPRVLRVRPWCAPVLFCPRHGPACPHPSPHRHRLRAGAHHGANAVNDLLPAAASADHLTAALRRCGVLGGGRVSDAAVASVRTTLLSRIIRLSLRYEGAADGAPASLILKTELPERAGPGWNAMALETAFYTGVAAGLPAGLVPRCFDASWDAAAKTGLLLLEDLGDTHVMASDWPLPPPVEACERIVRARARCHAAWWDDPRLGVSIGTWLDDEALERQRQRFAAEFASFADRAGDLLSRERRALYERLIEDAPRLLARYRTHRNMTIVQGDAHVWNAFLPRDGGADVRFFDWDWWRVDVATDDLAYMIALHWYPERRKRCEAALLGHYHEALVASGVRGYDRRALDEDYRLSVLWQLATPVWQAVNAIPPMIWWNNLERVLLAVDDLGCRELVR